MMTLSSDVDHVLEFLVLLLRSRHMPCQAGGRALGATRPCEKKVFLARRHDEERWFRKPLFMSVGILRREDRDVVGVALRRSAGMR